MSLGRIIDITYFIGSIEIANTEQPEVEDHINSVVDRVQRNVLLEALGHTLYAELYANYDTAVNDKWKKLVEGDDYTVEVAGEDYTIHWNGLKNSEKLSMLAYFAYWEIMKELTQSASGIGLVNSKAENADKIDPRYKMTKAWNDGICLYGSIAAQPGESFVYDEMPYINRMLLKPSLCNYIIAKNEEDSTNYQKWIFTEKGYLSFTGL